MIFGKFAGSFSFKNKYLGHLYGITEISFIVEMSSVIQKLAIFQCSLWSVAVTVHKGNLTDYNVPFQLNQPQASIYKRMIFSAFIGFKGISKLSKLWKWKPP